LAGVPPSFVLNWLLSSSRMESTSPRPPKKESSQSIVSDSFTRLRSARHHSSPTTANPRKLGDLRRVP
jgi:hypothetical protein